jgi:hypothetical protein
MVLAVDARRGGGKARSAIAEYYALHPSLLWIA